MRALWKQMRPHQWAKNILLAVPFLAAHQWSEPELWWRSILAFVVFCALASSVYIFNDFCDLKSDRANPLKRHRPLAAGLLSVGMVTGLGLVLLVVAALGCWHLGAAFAGWAAAYLLVNVAYSLRLKSLHTADVLCLASLYTLRILAGGAATEVPISPWLLSFSAFLFLSLALVKRISELLRLEVGTSTGRDYRHGDIQVLMALGAASAYASILVLALYLRSPEVSMLYSRPQLLWLLTPLGLYWLTRLWILTMRGQVHEDPVLFALKDPVGWGTLLAGVACLALAT